MIVFVHIGYGQKQLFITPSLGMAFPLSYTISPSAGDIGYGPNTFDFGASLDLSLQYQINQQWIIFAGLRTSNDTGFSIRYGDPDKDFLKGGLSTASHTIRFPIGFQKHVSTHKWFKVKRRATILKNISGEKNEDILYLALFRLRILAGFSYNYTEPMTDDNQLSSFSSGTFTYNVIERNTFSASLGVTLQFFNYEKNHIQLTILYSQGLSQVLTSTVNYELVSGNYEAIIGSRGSYISLQLGYPIRIADFSKKKN
jgi:hypothetical protein